MRTRSTKTKTACALVLGLLALSIFSSVPRAGAVGPAITVNPTNPLIGQVITVVGAGFPASSGGTVWIDLNGNGMLDKIESAYSVHFQTSTTGSFVAFLPTFDLAMSTYTVFAQLPDGGSVVASTQINVQDPAVNAIQNAQSVISKQLSGAQSALSSQIGAVQSDLDNKIGSPMAGSTDTLFSLLYGIQNAIASGFAGMQAQLTALAAHIDAQFAALSAQLNVISNNMDTGFSNVDSQLASISSELGTPNSGGTVFSDLVNIQTGLSQANTSLNTITMGLTNISKQLTGVQTDLDNRIGSPNMPDCAIGGCPPPDTVFSLLYQIDNNIGSAREEIAMQTNRVQTDIDLKLGTPAQGETVFGDLANIATLLGTPTSTSVNTLFGQLNTIRQSTDSISGSLGSPNGMIGTNTAFGLLYGIQYSVTVLQSDVDNRLGTAKTGETVFGDLQSISSDLPAVQKSLSNIQTNMGTPNTGETVFGDLQSIQSTLNSLSGLQSSISNLQNSLNKLSNTATVISGGGLAQISGTNPEIVVFQNNKVCTVTVTVSAFGQTTNEQLHILYLDVFAFPPVALQKDLPNSTFGFTDTAAAASVAFSGDFPSGDTNTIGVYYEYSAICPAS